MASASSNETSSAASSESLRVSSARRCARSSGGASRASANNACNRCQRAWSISSGGGELSVEPGASEGPVTTDGGRRDVEGGGGFVDAESTEEPALDHPCLTSIDALELQQRVADRNEIVERRVMRGGDILIEGHGRPATASLFSRPPLGVVDEDIAHRPGRDSEEMRPILPVDLARRQQLQERFMYQVGWCQRMSGPFPIDPPAGDLLRLVVNAGEYPTQR